MDALRKAEREKKEAAERLREKQQSISEETAESTRADGLSLSLVEDDSNQSSVQESPDDNDTPAPDEQYTTGDDPDATLAEPMANLSLGAVDEQPPESGADTSEFDRGEVSAKDDKGGSHEPGSSDDAGLLLETSRDTTASGHGENLTIDMSDEAGEETLGAGGVQPDDDTLVLENRSYQSSPDDSATLSDTLEQGRTHSGSSTREATREFAKAGVSSYTPVSAQNVFAARKSASYPTITIGILMVLVTVGLAAYGVFYYFSVTPINRDMPSPAVAHGVEATEALPVVPEAAEINTGTMADEIEPPEILPIEQPAPVPAAEAPSASAVETAAATLTEEDASAGEMILPEVQRPEPVKPADTAESGESPVSPVREEIELKPQLLQISRSKEPPQENLALRDAYSAFKSGDLETAGTLYRSVYSKDQDNIDALLGLAAIAVREQRHGQAYDYYSAVLRLNPANPDARAAIINLQQQVDPAVSGSRIRQLLEQYPGSAYLHYALGNVYARQKRWPDAQQEYFSAYSGDSENPDYALNLAVSMDHMNKRDAALQYYEVALKLAGGGTAGFDVAVIEQRIRELAR
ncbi:MAG: hypothetical protein U5P41_00810 [Gammaproteobacteria bacterium]|nr:hypothetical protein [Gammaproteobacteria bacterium]